MKKGRAVRLLLWFVAAIILLLIIFSFISFEPPGALSLLENNLAQNLNRKVQIEKIRVNLLGKITLKDVTIQEREKDSAYPFIKIGYIRLNIDIPRLIFRKINISKIRLRNPQLFLRLDKKGLWNFEDLIKMEMPEKPQKDIAFALSDIEISDGSVIVRDEKIKEGGVQTELDDIQLKSSGFIKLFPSNVNLSATLKSNPPSHIKFNASSRLFSRPPVIGLRLSFDQFPLSAAEPYLRGACNLRISGLKAEGFYSDGRLSLPSVSFEIGKGRVDSSLDLKFSDKKLEHKEEVKIEDVAIEEALPANSALKQNISGRASLFFKAGGEGLTPDSLKGNFNLTVKNGRVKALPIQNTVSLLLGIPEIQDISFNNISGDFTIQDGKISTQNFKLLSRELNVYAKGYCDLNSHLAYNITISLSPELSRRVNLGRIVSYFTDEAGNLNIELKIGGTFARPEVDWLSGQIEKVIETGIGEILKGILKEKGGDAD